MCPLPLGSLAGRGAGAPLRDRLMNRSMTFFSLGTCSDLGVLPGLDEGPLPVAGGHHYRGQLSHGVHVPTGERYRLHEVRVLRGIGREG